MFKRCFECDETVEVDR